MPELLTRLKWAAGVAVLAAVIGSWLAGKFTAMSGFGLLMGYWVVASVATDFLERIAPRGGMQSSFWHRARQIPRAGYGMMLAHLGIAAFIFGVTMVRTHELERDVKLAPGASVELDGRRFTLESLSEVKGANYDAVRGLVVVAEGERVIARMQPEKRIYRVQTMPMTEAAIRTRLSGDMYVSLGEPVDNGQAWIVRIYIKPYVSWIWGGCGLMALGGLLASLDRRYRAKKALVNTAIQPDSKAALAA